MTLDKKKKKLAKPHRIQSKITKKTSPRWLNIIHVNEHLIDSSYVFVISIHYHTIEYLTFSFRSQMLHPSVVVCLFFSSVDIPRRRLFFFFPHPVCLSFPFCQSSPDVTDASSSISRWRWKKKLKTRRRMRILLAHKKVRSKEKGTNEWRREQQHKHQGRKNSSMFTYTLDSLVDERCCHNFSVFHFFPSLFSLHFDCLLLELHTLTHTFLSFSPSIFSIIHSSYFNLFFSPPIYTNERDVWKRSSLNVNYIIARTMTMVCSRVYLLFFCFGMLIRKENEWPCFVKMSRMIFSISEGQYWFVKTSLHTLRSYIHFVLLLFPVQISLAFVE